MARVLLLSYFFSPDGLSTANLVSELAQDLRAHGHEVRAIATVPHYNYEPEARARQPLQRRWWGLFHRSDFDGIPVWHTTIGRQRGRGEGRIVAYLIYNAISLLLGLFAVGRVDVVLVVSPPLTSGPVGWLLKLRHRARLIYNVQELYPDTYVTMGAMRADSLTARVLYALERFVYRAADALTPISEMFAEALRAKGVPDGRIHVIPNFVDTEAIAPGSKDNPLAREWELDRRFVALYAGNIGLSQSFDTLLEVAARLQDEPEIVILIVGDGVRRAEIAAAAAKLPNVVMLPYQPRSAVPYIYASADLGLVPLMAGTARTTLPSKLYTIMAAGLPALVAVDPDSDIVRAVTGADCGVAIPPDDADALEAAIREAHRERDRFRQMGAAGRRYVEAHYARAVIARRYHALFGILMGG